MGSGFALHVPTCGSVLSLVHCKIAPGKLGNVIKKTLATKKSVDATGPRITKLVYNDNKYKNMKALKGKTKKSVKAIYKLKNQ